MEVTFKRILTNELLTTYLPSFFLLGISYSTTFFKQFFFEAAVTVNLTVMLVATTLFIRFFIQKKSTIEHPLFFIFSVMDKLPPVSYIRMVDIWLISVQLVPFVYVILLNALELNADTVRINHHGMTRQEQNITVNCENNNVNRALGVAEKKNAFEEKSNKLMIGTFKNLKFLGNSYLSLLT